MLLKETQKNRLLDQIGTVVNESKILVQQTIISKNYLNFHSNYTELKSFLEKIETNSDQELKNKIRQLPSLPSPNKSFSGSLIQLIFFLSIINFDYLASRAANLVSKSATFVSNAAIFA